MYCFQITTDHLSAPEEPGDVGGTWIGPLRPKDADRTRSRMFHLYDDDQTLAYSGRLYWSEGPQPSEPVCYELWRWGAAQAGTTVLRFHGRPDWTIA